MSLLIAVGAFAFAAVAALSSRLQNSVPHPASAPAKPSASVTLEGQESGEVRAEP